MWKYVFCVVVILAWPNLFAMLATETPANNKREACVCLKPWILITGILALMQTLLSISLIVEL